MTNALVGIALALFLSLSSLAVVLLRVSPLTSSEYALPFFFLSIFIAVASCTTLILSVIKGLLTKHAFKSRNVINSSLRQGVFVAIATSLVILLFLLRIVNWWIALLIYAVFMLIEMAIGR
jgi:hypothetical protein